MGDAVDDRAHAQLRVLGEISTILSLRDVPFWVRGGWAIDFLLGRLTRPHADIDLVTWARDRGRSEQALIEAGFQLVSVTEVQTNFRKHDIDISFVYLTRARNGHTITHGIPAWVWRDDAFLAQRFTLHGISVRVVNPHQLLEEKEAYEEGTGRSPRPKDLESMRILQSIVETD